MKDQRLVTRDQWGVGYESGRGEGVVLHVYRFPCQDRPQLIVRGDGYGKRFASTDEARQWALEHGYLQVMRSGWCPTCREQCRSIIGQGRSSWCSKCGRFC